MQPEKEVIRDEQKEVKEIINEIIKKDVIIDNHLITIYKSIPLKPLDMYSFLIKKLPIEKDKKIDNDKEREKYKRNHQDYKHIFDYVESIKTQNDIHLLSIISIPECPNDSIGLGNFFGKKMNNITKDLKIFPFGNSIISNLSLASKRATDHPTFIILSLRGNKHLNDQHPSNPNPIDINKNTVGYFLMENWCNTICKRYINYLQINGLNSCVDTRFVKFIKPNNENETKNETENTKINQPENESENIEKKEYSPDSDLKENNIIEKVMTTGIKSDGNNVVSGSDMGNINLQINKLFEKNTVIFENKYLKYQEQINSLKLMIFYLIENKGVLDYSIYNKFDISLLNELFGNDFYLYLENPNLVNH
jgi:hypothetical protein